MNFKEVIRVIEGFPKPGISFKDITTLLKDGNYYKQAIDTLVKEIKPWNPELVVGPEARGFLFGAPVAYSLGVGFVPVRKPGKLPAATVSESYELEYGTDTLDVHADAIKPGQRVVIVDDLLATGGTMLATAKLVEKAGGVVVGMAFLIELEALGGRKKLADYKVVSLVNYND